MLLCLLQCFNICISFFSFCVTDVLERICIGKKVIKYVFNTFDLTSFDDLAF